MKFKWKFQLFGISLVITPLLLSACSSFGFGFSNTNPPFSNGWGSNVDNPYKPTQTLKSQMPILDYLKNAPNGVIPSLYQLPNYQQNHEVFDFISARTIGISVIVSTPTFKYNQLQESISLDSGTATILGPADAATAAGRGFAYYISTNVHVANSFNFDSQYSKDKSRIEGFYFNFNRLLDDYLPEKTSFPTTEQLTNGDDDNLVSNFNLSQFTSVPRLKWTQNNKNPNNQIQGQYRPGNWAALYRDNTNNYYPTYIDQNTFYTATNISINNPENSRQVNNLRGEQTSYTINYSDGTQKQKNFAADFAVMKIDFSDTYRWAQKYGNQKVSNFITNLQDSQRKYGEMNFNSNYNSNGYLTGMPSLWNNNEDEAKTTNFQVMTVSLKIAPNQTGKFRNLNDFRLDPNDTREFLEFNKNYYLTPVYNYLVQYLNLGPGSSGSLLINYDPTQTDLKKRFSANGIYWGAFIGSRSNNTLDNSTGAMTKLIVPGKYNLIGGSYGLSNTPEHNSFCSYLTTKHSQDSSVWLPGFCGSN